MMHSRLNYTLYGFMAYFLLALLSACNNNPTAGGVLETTNSIAGTVTEEGGPAAGVTVRLRRSDYLSSIHHLLPQKRSGASISRMDTVTDEDGGFRIDSVDPGSYVIEIVNSDSLAAMHMLEVTTDDSLIPLPAKEMDSMAIITGIIKYPPGITSAHVQVYGLERLVATDSLSGSFRLSVPSGSHKLHVISIMPGISPVDVKVTGLKPGESRDIGIVYPGYAMVIPVDTIVTGALKTRDGTPARSTLIKLIPESFKLWEENLPDSLMAITNADGEYSFKGIRAGKYHIEATDLNDAATAYIQNITVSDDTTLVPTDTLRASGRLIVWFPDTVTFTGGLLPLAANSYITFSA